MYFQLLKVILWPRAGGVPRELQFRPGVVNVISGASKTGKSAVIPIIDYCLGSEKCAIPVGVIREACSWFGIVVDTVEGQKLLARREPGSQQSTGDMVLLEGAAIRVPSKIEAKSTNVDQVKSMLNRLAGLSNQDFEPGPTDNFKSRPSFRDLMAFTFQPQNIIANPDVLFFKADTTEHREKLKTIFPYVLGAISSELLQARHELERLTKLLRRKEAELRARQSASAAWQREGQTWIHQSIEYGLLPSDSTIPDDWSTTVDLMRRVSASDARKAVPSLDGTDLILDRLTRLRELETTLSVRLNEGRQRLRELRRLEESSDAYGTGLKVQRDRLALSEWLRSLVRNPDTAIFEPSESMRAKLDQLCGALSAIEVRLSTHPVVGETVGRETLRQREITQVVLDELKSVRQELQTLEGNSKALHDASVKGERVERFLGRMDEALRLYDAADEASSLQSEIGTLRDQIRQLTKLVSEQEISQKLTAAIDSLQEITAKLIPKMDGEWPDAPVRLIIPDLTVKVIRGARDDYLWEIGSGANWLAYHIAISLALQSYFMRDRNHPVPGLLIYDQPSQVYFPARRAAPSANEGADPPWKNEDVLAVRKVFDLLDRVVRKAKQRLQVIVLDHADEDVWGGLHDVHLVEEWRGSALVPMTWLPEEKSDD